ncbi:MAG: methyltransferase domain-containing protein [Propionibacteriales bacterium]|nr:methyltransferase domain-containing protein [Propionibacteriales bacterium]
MRPQDFTALLTPAGQGLLDRLSREYDETGELDELAVAARLRRDHDPGLVSAALTQTALRRRAAAKFGADAAVMYFTPEALEQATSGPVAAHRAARFRESGLSTVVDLGCGIGGDLIALARTGITVTGMDRDPLRVMIARANLAALGLPGELRAGDVTETDVGGSDGFFLDPARRDERGRTLDPSAYTPPWSFAEDILRDGDGCVKTGPAVPRDAGPDGAEIEWVSLDGDLKEAAVWSPGLAAARRRATLLPGGHALTDEEDRVSPAGPVRPVLYEPDAAVIRAGLVGAVAARVGGTLLDPHIAFVCADHPVTTPFARGYRVIEELPYREKALRAALRARDVGPLTIKKRGVQVTPELLRRRLGLRGSRAATLVLSRHGRRAVALLVEPLSIPAG